MADMKLTPEIVTVIENSRIDANMLTLPAQLDRKLYLKVNTALEAAGGKWNKAKKCHVFDGPPRERLGLVVAAGIVVDERKAKQSFYTPFVVASELVQLANVAGLVVLEPSAGMGSLVKACLNAGACRVDCVESDQTCHAALVSLDTNVNIADFLSLPAIPQYYRIVMNPPFSKGKAVKHIAHAAKWLRPGGMLFAIVPDKDEPKLTDLGAVDVAKIAAGAFKESGTQIATKIIKITR